MWSCRPQTKFRQRRLLCKSYTFSCVAASRWLGRSRSTTGQAQRSTCDLIKEVSRGLSSLCRKLLLFARYEGRRLLMASIGTRGSNKHSLRPESHQHAVGGWFILCLQNRPPHSSVAKARKGAQHGRPVGDYMPFDTVSAVSGIRAGVASCNSDYLIAGVTTVTLLSRSVVEVAR